MGEVNLHLRSLMEDAIVDAYGRTQFNGLVSFARRGAPFCSKRLEGSVFGHAQTVSRRRNGQRLCGGQRVLFPEPERRLGILRALLRQAAISNIKFFDNLNRLQFGVTYMQSDFFRFRRSIG